MKKITKKNEKEEVSTPPNYVGFWLRLVAFIIDCIVIVIASKILFGDRIVTMSGGSVSAQFDGIFILIPLLYVILFWKFFGATPGKMILKMQIVSEDNKELSWKNVLMRAFGYFISAIVILIGFFWIGFDKNKQGWHDKIAKTLVIKK
jgi:uncharacterized RDD family membrane protein YckC